MGDNNKINMFAIGVGAALATAYLLSPKRGKSRQNDVMRTIEPHPTLAEVDEEHEEMKAEVASVNETLAARRKALDQQRETLHKIDEQLNAFRYRQNDAQQRNDGGKDEMVNMTGDGDEHGSTDESLEPSTWFSYFSPPATPVQTKRIDNLETLPLYKAVENIKTATSLVSECDVENKLEDELSISNADKLSKDTDALNLNTIMASGRSASPSSIFSGRLVGVKTLQQEHSEGELLNMTTLEHSSIVKLKDIRVGVEYIEGTQDKDLELHCMTEEEEKEFLSLKDLAEQCMLQDAVLLEQQQQEERELLVSKRLIESLESVHKDQLALHDQSIDHEESLYLIEARRRKVAEDKKIAATQEMVAQLAVKQASLRQQALEAKAINKTTFVIEKGPVFSPLLSSFVPARVESTESSSPTNIGHDTLPKDKFLIESKSSEELEMEYVANVLKNSNPTLDIIKLVQQQEEMKHLADLLYSSSPNRDISKMVDELESKPAVFSTATSMPTSPIVISEAEEFLKHRHVEGIKHSDRPLYEKCIRKIKKFLSRHIVRKKYARMLDTMPFVVEVELIRGSNIIEEGSLFTFGVNPDIYVSLTGITSDGICFSRSQSASVRQDSAQWNEKHAICLQGDNGKIVLNVMSAHVLSGDNFIGQAVIELAHYKAQIEESNGEAILINAGILGMPAFPVYNSVGKQDVITRSTEGGGILRLKLSYPSKDNSQCGWVHAVSDIQLPSSLNFFGGGEIIQMWVIYFETCFYCYSTPFCKPNGLLKTVLPSTIAKCEEIAITALGITLTALKITIKLDVGFETITWAWGLDCRLRKNHWLRVLRASCKTELARNRIRETASSDSFASADGDVAASVGGRDVKVAIPSSSGGRRTPRGKRENIIAVGPTPLAKNIDFGWS